MIVQIYIKKTKLEKLVKKSKNNKKVHKFLKKELKRVKKELKEYKKWLKKTYQKVDQDKYVPCGSSDYFSSC